MSEDDNERDESRSERDEQREIAFWWGRIEAAMKNTDHVNHLNDKKEARAFYAGDQMSSEEQADWGGDTVVANLFRRTVNFITDSVYSEDPAIRCTARRRAKNDPKYLKTSETVEMHLRYVYDEEDLSTEVKSTWKDSYFGNCSGTKIDFDKERGLWRAKWVAGEIVCDPEAFGDVRRARWIAEHVQLPRYRVWQDTTFDKEARQELKERQGYTGSETDATTGNDESDGGHRTDVESLWYIYTKEGIDPHKNEDSTPKVRLIVMAENFDRWLLNKENPCPYLDSDEFPYELLRIDLLPGKFNGPALWRQVSAVCKAFNWAASYHMEDMRKTASRAMGYDEDRLDDPTVLDGRTHMTKVACTGDPSTVVAPLNLGQADKTIFDSVNFWRDMLDKLTGIDDIARGEEGVQKTATESEILQRNSSITMKGPGAALDRFLAGMIRKIGLASLYYIPAFSVVVGPQGVVMTKQKVQTFEMDQMTGLPIMDEMGQPVPAEQIQEVPVQWDENEAAQYGAQVGPDGMVMANPESEGKYLIKGIDYFHDEEAAAAWPDDIPFEQVKCDLHIKIEAGSSRAGRRAERQRNAQALLATVGLELKELGAWGHYYEILTEVVESLDLPDKDKKWPTKDEFVQMHEQQQMMLMQSMQGAPGGAPGAANPDMFDEGTNPGTTYPSEAPATGE